jgi:hypothetical protein
LEAGNIYPTAVCLGLSPHHSRLTNQRGIRDSSRKFLDTIIQIMQVGFKELTARSLTGGYRRDGVKYFSGTLSILQACCTSIAVYLRLILALLRLYFGCDLCISSPPLSWYPTPIHRCARYTNQNHSLHKKPPRCLLSVAIIRIDQIHLDILHTPQDPAAGAERCEHKASARVF